LDTVSDNIANSAIGCEDATAQFECRQLTAASTIDLAAELTNMIEIVSPSCTVNPPLRVFEKSPPSRPA
jgi:hypothetical protein